MAGRRISDQWRLPHSVSCNLRLPLSRGFAPDSRVPPDPPEPTLAPTGREFCTTHWSVVLAARDTDGMAAAAALEALCQNYWRPVYAFLRRSGHDSTAAQDLTQEFLARFIHGGALHQAMPGHGRFRSYVLGTLKHFLSDERKRARAQKRGGGHVPIPLDEVAAEQWCGQEPSIDVSPERVFDRHWAVALLARAVDRLQREYETSGRERLFGELRQFHPDGDGAPPYAIVAARLGLSEAAFKSALHRFRLRHREILREEVRRTLTPDQDLEDELRYLLQVL